MDREARMIPLLIASLVLPGLLDLMEAQNLPEPEQVLVTVSAEAIPASVTSASVTVVGQDLIRNCGCENVVELLRMAPSLHVSQSGVKGGMATVSIRGGEESFALIMVDGIPVNDITNLEGGAVDLSVLSTDNVDRIEIVRGPLSSLYGSEAIGGVINIISHQGSGKPGFNVFGDVGSFNSLRVGGGSSGKVGLFDYSLGASYFDISEQVESDSFSLGTVSLASGLDLGASRVLRFTLRYSDSSVEGFPSNGGGPEFSLVREPRRSASQDLVFGADYQGNISSSSIYDVRFDFFRRDEKSVTPPILDAIPPSFLSIPSSRGYSLFQRLRVSLGAGWQVRPDLSINGTVGLEDASGESSYLFGETTPSDFEAQRDTGSAGGELLYRVDRLSAHLGLRVDKSGGFDSEFSPRLGLNLQVHPSSRLKVNWGEGYKLPSFYALSEPNVGNPALKPELSRGFDIGVESTLLDQRLSAGLTYFHNEFRDLIDFSPELFQLVNRAEATTQGFEVEVKILAVRGLDMGGHLTHLIWEIPDTSEQLRNRPNWRGGFNLTWKPVSPVNVMLDTLWVGSRYDFQVPLPERDTVEGYSTTNLAFTYRWLPQLEFYARADNLLNRKYHEFIGFPNPGLNVRAGLRYSYGR
jgi:iron complex outermembrane receptor protein/vitamin B12 transporter